MHGPPDDDSYKFKKFVLFYLPPFESTHHKNHFLYTKLETEFSKNLTFFVEVDTPRLVGESALHQKRDKLDILQVPTSDHVMSSRRGNEPTVTDLV